MRSTLIIACAIVVFAAGAKAQDALKPCRQIKDDGKRLKCYDRLDRSSSSARERLGQSRPGGATAWIITDEKSPLDDSPLVSAALASSDDRSRLLMRCKDRKTEVAVSAEVSDASTAVTVASSVVELPSPASSQTDGVAPVRLDGASDLR